MIKNIIFDIGGVIFDDSLENISKILNGDSKNIYKKAFGGNFKKCLLGQMTINEHIESFKNDMDYNSIAYILKKENLDISYPLIEKNLDYIKELKSRGYNLFLLSNITEDSYFYIKNKIDIDKIFNGGVYSYQENLIKPDINIYELIVNRYTLNKEETIFFDDKEKNVIAANSIGVKGVLFKTCDDIIKNI